LRTLNWRILGMTAAICLGARMAAADAKHPVQVTRQGRTWNTLKLLPDWSGVWVLSDDSWHEVLGAVTGHDGGAVPLTPKYMAIRASNGAANDGAGPPGGIDDNSEKCIPVGTPGIGSVPLGHEYLYSPGRVTIIYEDGEVRRIDTSGRKHPAESELNDTFAGNSIGHWEGKTLVVDTIGILPQAQLFIGLRVSQKIHLTERISRRDSKTLQIETVVDGPEMFSAPYTYTRIYTHSTNPPFEYFPCTDDNRDPAVHGRQVDVDLTPPPAEKQ
jgi:hypothetical protein